jgi:hypothetical protein
MLFAAFSSFSNPAFTVGGSAQNHKQIAPDPIPILESTDTLGVGVLKIVITETGITDDGYITQIVIDKVAGDTLGTADIIGAKAYLNTTNPEKYTTPPGANAGELNLDSWTEDGSSVTLDVSELSAYLDTEESMIGADSSKNLWIAFDYSTSATATSALAGYACATVSYRSYDGLFTDTATATNAPTGTVTVARYHVTAEGWGLQPPASQGAQGTEVEVIRLRLGTGDEPVDKLISGIDVSYVGDDSADVNFVNLYLDDGDDTFDPGDTLLIASTITADVATLVPPTNNMFGAAPNPATITYFVTAVVDSNAALGNTVGLRISDPSTDINFGDAYADTGGSVSGEYDQIGFIESAVALPAADYEFTVIPADDGSPPTVIDTDPGTDDVDVPITATIEITFREGMDKASVENLANFVLLDGTATDISDLGTQVYDEANQKMIYTHPVPFENDVTYTARATTGMEDFYNNAMLADYEWDFTTVPEYPDFTEPTAVNNRIVSGGNDTVLIFVPPPPKGTTDRVSIQVFTTTGKLVKTFYKNVPHQSFAASLPIQWNGTNGNGDKLGPGLYFIQIRATDFKRVLKVMIVR